MTDTSYALLELACRRQPPCVAVVLGSGMGHVADRLCNPLSVPFVLIPGLAAASVHGHRGCMTLGDWGGRRVLLFEGRLHYYEGHAWEVVVRPIQTAAALGAPVAVLTNAAGGIADPLEPGSLMAIRDHIEWTRPFFWRCPGPGGFGPARSSPYSSRLLQAMAQAAQDTNCSLHEGVYTAVTGPSYETPAEIRAMKLWGGDAVGMSTAREITAAHAAGLECAAISLITNRAAGLSGGALNHKEVLTTAANQSTRLADLLERFLAVVDTGH